MLSRHLRALGRGILGLALTVTALGSGFAPRPAMAATSTDVFFSEYIEGSSNNKALEIYNGTGGTIDLDVNKYRVEMYFNGATTPSLTINLTGKVANGDVYVLAQSTANAAILSQADLTNGSGWFNGDDAVVLRKDTTVLDVIGQIGFDPGSEWGTGLTSTFDNTLRRKADICAGDTLGNNAFDPSVEWSGFANDTSDGLGSHVANCSGSELAPAVTSTIPANNATSVSVATNITINFSEPVNVAAGQVTVKCSDNTVVASNAAASNVTSLVIDPASNLPSGVTCTVTVPAGAVTDVDGNDPPDTLTATFSTGFTTELSPCQQPTTKISAIQGPGNSAVITGPVTVEGVVTAIFPGLQGINLQEEPADEDGNPSTSEGIGVFLGSSFNSLTNGLQVGDVIRLSGTASERTTSGVQQTQLSGTISITDCGQSPVTITPVDVMFPLDSVTDLERYESMLVRFPQQLFISEYFNYDRFGEIVLGYAGDLQADIGETGRFYNPTSITTPGTPANTLAAKYAVRRITLDDAVSASPPSSLPHPNGQPFSQTNRFRGGDTVTGQVGVIENSFGIYRIQPTAYGSYNAVNDREEAPPEVGGRLKVASYNVLNYFLTVDTTSSSSSGPCGPLRNADCRGADSAEEFARQRSKLIEALKAIDADIYGLIELENTPGVEPLADIVNGLNAAVGADTFAYVNTGVIGSDAIKVGLIYKHGTVEALGSPAILDSQAFVNPLNANVDRNRPAVAQTFVEKATGATFTVVVNHLKSKGSGCGDVDSDKGDGQGNCNRTRTLSAKALLDWLATDPTDSGDADILLMGDLNAYAKEDPITAIKAGADNMASTADDFVNLIEDRLGTFAYSYVFDGQNGYLDHALASKTLNSQVTGVADWHLNSDEPDIFDYNDTVQDIGENTNGSERKGLDVTDTASPFRTADHDPVLVGLDLNAAPTVDAGGSYSVAEGGSVALDATGTDSTYASNLEYAWDFDGDGQFDDATGASPSFSAAQLDGPTSVTVGVQVTDDLGLTGTDTATIDVSNVAPAIGASFASPSVACSVASTLSGTISDPGADSFTAVVDWGDGSAPESVTVTGGTFSASHTYARAGTHTAKVTATDDDGASAQATATTAVDYTVVGGGLLQPINQDGSSIFRAGSTIPVKVKLQDCDGSFPTSLAPKITLTQLSGSTPGGQINEPISTSGADTTGVLRYDAASQQYIYNLSTRALPDPTATYEIVITVPATGQTVKGKFGLK